MISGQKSQFCPKMIFLVFFHALMKNEKIYLFRIAFDFKDAYKTFKDIEVKIGEIIIFHFCVILKHF